MGRQELMQTRGLFRTEPKATTIIARSTQPHSFQSGNNK